MMRKIIVLAIFSTAFLMTSCKESKTESNVEGVQISDSTKEASFEVDGKTYNGKVSTQYFGSNKATDNFSVLCQQDEPFTLLQATFANEKDASSPNLKPKGESYKVSEGEFELSLSVSDSQKEFVSNEKSGGTIKVSGNEMVISDMKLFDADGKEKTVNATIKF